MSAFVLFAVIAAVAAIDVQQAPEPPPPPEPLPRAVILSLTRLRVHVRPIPQLGGPNGRRPRATPVFFPAELDPRSGELEAVAPRRRDPAAKRPLVIVDL
jgi:hypothetical protein